MRLSHPVTYAPLDVRGAALALLCSLLWGVNPVALKIGLQDAPPLRMAALRLVVGGLVLLGWAWPTGRLAGFRIGPGEWRPVLMVGLLLTVQIGSMNYATALTSAAHVAIILNLYAVHTVVLSHFFIPGDRLTVGKLAGVLIAYAGIVLLFIPRTDSGGGTLAGDAIMFASALVLAARTVYLARAVQMLDPVKLLLTQALFGSVVLFPMAEVLEPAPVRWTLRFVGALGFQGVAVAGFNFAVNLWLLKRYRPSALSGFFLTQPLFGVVAATLFTGDRLTPELLIACTAVAIGIGLTSR
jgi:drug/metabolite transporter (DMT)-like permease